MKLIIRVQLDGAEATPAHVPDLLRALANRMESGISDRVRDGNIEYRIADANGNTIGSAAFVEDPIDGEEARLFRGDILITACEGGSNHWAEIHNYKPIAGTVTIVNGDDGRSYDVDDATIKRGLDLIVIGSATIGERDLVMEALTTLDASDIDASIADAILQIALFDQVVYG